MARPSDVRSREYSTPGSTIAALQLLVLHAMVLPDGHLVEAEILASSDASLNQRAMDRLANWQSWRTDNSEQPGASPQSHEVFFPLGIRGSGHVRPSFVLQVYASCRLRATQLQSAKLASVLIDPLGRDRPYFRNGEQHKDEG